MVERVEIFGRVRTVVEALEALCAEPRTGYMKDHPIVSTEVYNEGWMLRLVIAKLHDTDNLQTTGDPEQDKRIQLIRDASRLGWCSEGRVFPLFCGEHSTCADGIVGDIALRADTTWGFGCRSGNFAILEAKMGSPLSDGVKNDSSFNQAARNVACISGMEHENATGHFFVLAPRQSKHYEEICEHLNTAADIAGLCVDAGTERHKFRECLDAAEIKGRIKALSESGRIGLITWEELLGTLPHDGFISDFYKKAKLANSVDG